MEIKTKFDIGQAVWVWKSEIMYLQNNEKDKPMKLKITAIHYYEDDTTSYDLNYNYCDIMEWNIFEKKEDCWKF